MNEIQTLKQEIRKSCASNVKIQAEVNANMSITITLTDITTLTHKTQTFSRRVVNNPARLAAMVELFMAVPFNINEASRARGGWVY